MSNDSSRKSPPRTSLPVNYPSTMSPSDKNVRESPPYFEEGPAPSRKKPRKYVKISSLSFNEEEFSSASKRSILMRQVAEARLKQAIAQEEAARAAREAATAAQEAADLQEKLDSCLKSWTDDDDPRKAPAEISAPGGKVFSTVPQSSVETDSPVDTRASPTTTIGDESNLGGSAGDSTRDSPTKDRQVGFSPCECPTTENETQKEEYITDDYYTEDGDVEDLKKCCLNTYYCILLVFTLIFGTLGFIIIGFEIYMLASGNVTPIS